MPKYPAFKQAKIPFELKMTDRFVNSLMKIAESKPFLDEVLATPLEVQLLRQAKIRAITYSNQIEGNKLDERAVTALIGSNPKKVDDKDAREILNYQTALAYAEELAIEAKLPTARDFCDLQRLVTNGLIQTSQLGRLRSIPVSIMNEVTGREIDKCPEPHLLPALIEDLWRWLKDTENANPFGRAFAFHYIAVAIHPFADGNGRTVRLFQHLLLLRQGEKMARYVPSETMVMRNRDRYYAAIRQSKSLQSLHPMMEFMAECFADSANEVVEDARRLFEVSKKLSPEARRKKILKLAKQVESFQMKDVVAALPEVPRRTLERDIESLLKEKVLKAAGERKGRRYELGRSPSDVADRIFKRQRNVFKKLAK